MCGPPALAIAAAVVSAAGSVMGGIQAKQQGNYEAKVAESNARMANEQARDAIDRGKIQQQQHDREVADTRGAQTAALAAGGVDTSFGSARSLAEDTSMIGAEDTAAISRNTYNEVRGFDINAANYRSQAQASRMKGKAGFTKSLFDAGSTLLGGASQYSKLKAGN